MAKRSDGVGVLLDITRKTVQYSPPELIKECKDFLNGNLKCYIEIDSEKLSNAEYIARLQIVEKAASRVARSLNVNRLRTKAEIPDSEITFNEIMAYKDKRLNELKQHAEVMLDILNKEHLPPSIRSITNRITKSYCTRIGTVGEEVIQESLSLRLISLISALEKLPSLKTASKKNKKDKVPRPYKREAIHALTDAWMDITDKEPENLKRGTATSKNHAAGKCYGEFYNFMKKGMELFDNIANAEEANKIACKYAKSKRV